MLVYKEALTGRAACVDVNTCMEGAFSTHLMMFTLVYVSMEAKNQSSPVPHFCARGMPMSAYNNTLFSSQLCRPVPVGISANGCPSIYLHSVSITLVAPFGDSEAFRSSPVTADLMKVLLLDLGSVGSDPCSACITSGSVSLGQQITLPLLKKRRGG